MSSSPKTINVGGGAKDVGTVTPGMQALTWDEKTKPMTRTDMIAFLVNPNNMTVQERKLLERTFYYGVSSCLVAGVAGWFASGRLPWRRLQKLSPSPWFTVVGRVAMTGAAVSIPFMATQQWAI